MKKVLFLFAIVVLGLLVGRWEGKKESDAWWKAHKTLVIEPKPLMMEATGTVVPAISLEGEDGKFLGKDLTFPVGGCVVGTTQQNFHANFILVEWGQRKAGGQ